MGENELRSNSLRLRFERGDPEPSDADIFSFMKDKMALKCDSLLSMYKEKHETSVIIKFKKEEDAQRALMRLPRAMEFHYNKYQSANVKLSMANAIMRYVRLFNLPPEVEDAEIEKVMSEYGKITRLVRETYAEETGFPIWTSVRGVYMELKDDVEVPGTVLIRGQRARIFYEGQISRCYVCGSTKHIKVECPQRKTVNDRLQQPGPSSYSDALSGGGRWIKMRNATNTSKAADEIVTQAEDHQQIQLHLTALPLPPSNNVEFATEATTTAKEKETITQQQAEEDNVTATNEEPCISIAGGGNEKHNDDNMERKESATPSVPVAGLSKQWIIKSKRGRKSTRGKASNRNESDSEHSTTESDYQKGKGKQGREGKGATTRYKAKQQKISEQH